MNVYNVVVFFIFIASSVSLSAQDRVQLEQERMKVIESIESTDSLIKASEYDRQKGLITLRALKDQIYQRNTLLENIKKSILTAELEIESNQSSIVELQKKIRIIQKQYSALLRSRYVDKLKGSRWLSILSVSNINEAFLRWNYYRQFDSYRKSKLTELESVKSLIAKKNDEIKKYALENSSLIQEQQVQNSVLQKRIQQQNELLKEIKKDKSILQSQLIAIKESREALNKSIESKVFGELSGSKTTNSNLKQYGSNLSLVKGKVLLPVTNGYIEDMQVEDLSNNKSISIYVPSGAYVISIGAGKVVSVENLEGYGKMIILQHGNYYSVYANLTSVRVKTGDSVEENTKLGKVDKSIRNLHFELWKDKERLDAKKWIEG